MKKFINKALFVSLKAIVQTMLKIDRKFWKRYFNIETPLYKLWWNNHAKAMQKKLDKAAELRKAA